MPNTNCLAGIECPQCGSEGPFAIAVTAVAVMHDDGSEYVESIEWTKTSNISCMDCHNYGMVGEFDAEKLQKMPKTK